MPFNKLYVLAGSDMSVLDLEEDINGILQEVFSREAAQGRPAGRVFEEAVQRNVDIEIDTCMTPGCEDEMLKELTRMSFANCHPELNLAARPNFTLLTDHPSQGQAHRVCLVFAVE